MKNFDSHIDPEKLYPIETVAKIFEVTERWVRDNLVTPAECSYKRVGNTILFRGCWLISWVNRDFDRFERDWDLDDENDVKNGKDEN